MNRIDYFKNRARELRREAGDTSDPTLKQAKIELARAFERSATVAMERRRRKSGVSPPAVVRPVGST
jgi:hypothetical protein